MSLKNELDDLIRWSSEWAQMCEQEGYDGSKYRKVAEMLQELKKIKEAENNED